ncbi:MAG: PD-(D/E)XK nuclease family protein, partial [Victivallales bacterium]|nr:PD-(D/E)XK nuclease family protein [Victivallales bacterium]
GQKSRTFGAEEIAYDTPVRVINEPTIKGKPLDQPFSVISIPDKRNEAVQAVLVELIKETLQERDSEGHQAFAPSDLAVLLNSHTWEPHLQKLLRENGIPSVIVKEGNVFTSPIAVELRLFLLGVANPSDKGSVLGAMATVFSEQKLQEIPALADAPDSLAEQIAAFSEMKRIWETRGFAAMVSKMESSGYQLRLATKADGRRQLADLNQILELAFTAIKQIGKSPDALIDWLTDRINRSNVEKDTPEYSKRLETEGEAVKIMTIHGSKGLQFPVVFLPNCWNLCTDNDHRNKIVIPAYHNANNGHKLTFAFSDTAQTLAQNDQLQEKTRLLYVAMTRAVQRTNVIIPPDSDIDADEPLLRLLQNAKDNFARRQQADPTLVSPIAWLHQNIPQPTDDTRPAPAEGGNWQELACATPRSFANLRPSKGSYSSLSPAVQTNGDDDERDLDLSDRSQQESNSISQHDIFKIPSGATIGTCWHNILEKLPFQTTEQEISTLASEELLCCGFLPSQCLPETALTIQDLTVSMLQKTLDYRLTAPDGAQFSLRDVGWDKRLSEQEFNFSSAKASETTRELAEIISWHWQSDLRKAPFLEAMATWNRLIPQGFLNGFIDLIFQHGDFFYIIDWKSNSLEGKLENFCQEGLTREMASHGYFFQYLLYATVLHAYLRQTLGQDYSWERNFGGIRYYFL